MRSIEIYLDYLKKRDCYNNAREAEIQRIIDAVIEEQYHKKMETRRREQVQRKQLFCVRRFRKHMKSSLHKLSPLTMHVSYYFDISIEFRFFIEVIFFILPLNQANIIYFSSKKFVLVSICVSKSRL
jgi:hypothetical protein